MQHKNPSIFFFILDALYIFAYFFIPQYNHNISFSTLQPIQNSPHSFTHCTPTLLVLVMGKSNCTSGREIFPLPSTKLCYWPLSHMPRVFSVHFLLQSHIKWVLQHTYKHYTQITNSVQSPQYIRSMKMYL